MARLGKKPGLMRAYLNAVTRANRESLREVYEMGEDALAFDRMLEEIGLTAKWETRGISIGENKVLGLFRQGYTVEEVERMLAGRENGEHPLGGQRQVPR